MHQFYTFSVDNIDIFKEKVLQLSKLVDAFCYLDANNYAGYPYSNFGSFFAIDAIHTITFSREDKNILQQFEVFRKAHQSWLFGFLSYELKNDIECGTLYSNNIDGIDNPVLHFFIPKYIIKIEDKKVELGVLNVAAIQEFETLLNQRVHIKKTDSEVKIKHRITKDQYLENVRQIQEQIGIGNVYEMNFCQEFYAENTKIDTLETFQKLNELSQAPFSCYFKNNQNYLMCASPERFLKKSNQKLISQPIKGTRKRSIDTIEDNANKQELLSNEKELSENVMIVDLVRNDFSKIAEKNSVTVEELFGLYSFKQVHQLISTISCQIGKEKTFKDIIEAMFPMGSMTGAPKLAAMQLAENYEQTQRGLYSGAVGYITPKGNFDFNVVIRSILYNATRQYVSIQTGSAITIESDAEQEYEECLVKATALFEALK
ncbi:MAG: anthranilate synthase component I family protein [Bacteroidetes bacterium]|nr:anthranilate synthase component I family protein [Bacteroidota bacterium]